MIIVDEIIDTGLTLSWLLQPHLQPRERGRSAALLQAGGADHAGRREVTSAGTSLTGSSSTTGLPQALPQPARHRHALAPRVQLSWPGTSAGTLRVFCRSADEIRNGERPRARSVGRRRNPIRDDETSSSPARRSSSRPAGPTPLAAVPEQVRTPEQGSAGPAWTMGSGRRPRVAVDRSDELVREKPVKRIFKGPWLWIVLAVVGCCSPCSTSRPTAATTRSRPRP